tara:strand:- start:270 stop:542 length:273 start_codon:yes stop_codon:yes gene_type:complete
MMIQQQSFRFYDKHPEQLCLDVTQEQPQPVYSYNLTSINGGDGYHFAYNNISLSDNWVAPTLTVTDKVTFHDDNPSLIKRALFKIQGFGH